MIVLWRRLMRFAFHLLYNPFAFTYDLVSRFVSFGSWHCWQQTALKHLQAQVDNPVLELAFGTGHIQLDLSAAGYRPFGHDLSPNMITIAQRRLIRAGFSSRLTRGYAQQLPYRDGYFAAVVSTFPSEFILAPETLLEAARVLRPGGRFVIVPNAALVGGDPATRGIEALYWITGQREGAPDGKLQAVFERAGFALSLYQEMCPRSVATVLVAEKRG